eukprot:CAMPEP_0177785008 /NCGR_PEP_ID=MMETSP0491_2-20121128/20046_1 /TAXON_ID=63592 /ORGANISM="Tetraselmis chuii, Strain PLY429" /LENGTH=72 /DNA_ID=CAMNT_0019305895 /DNA_START=621 /DNA_END=839 /DNA_ORIENTATION=+
MWATLAPYGEAIAPRHESAVCFPPSPVLPAWLGSCTEGDHPAAWQLAPAPAPSPQDLRLQAPGEPNMLSNEE